MTYTTLGLGLALIAVGTIAYLATGRESMTAMLPAILGLLFVFLGLFARGEKAHRHAIHAALVLAVLAVIATAPQWISLPALIIGDDVERPAAVVASTLTALLCLAYIAVGVRSFVAARRSRGATVMGE